MVWPIWTPSTSSTGTKPNGNAGKDEKYVISVTSSNQFH
jgi:hypothetical protein